MLKAGRALPKHDWGLMQGRVWQCWLLTVGWCNICGSVLGMQAQHELHLSFYLIIHMYSFKHSHSSKVICYKMLLLCSHPELRFLSLTPVLLTHNGWDVLVSIQMSNMLQGMVSPELSFCTSGTKQPPLDFLLIGIKLLFSITPPAQYGLLGLCPWFEALSSSPVSSLEEWILPFVIMDTLYRILCQTEDLKLMAFRLKALTSPEVAAEETMSKVGTRKERVIIAFDNF